MTLQADLEAAIASAQAAAALLHDVVNGPASGTGSTVTVASGTLKTVAKAIADLEAAYASANVIAQVTALKDATLAAFASFQDNYLGAFAADPSTDIDGSALDGGELYFKTTSPVGMRVYDAGTASWLAAYVSAEGVLLIANALSELAGVAAAARTSLGLGDAAVKNTGTAAGTVAAGDHNHDADYAASTHNHAASGLTNFTEDVQDVIGAMIAAAGGSYDDGAGTISFPVTGAVSFVGNYATTSGTAIDFTGLSTTDNYLFVLNGVSTSAVSAIMMQLGYGSGTLDSGSNLRAFEKYYKNDGTLASAHPGVNSFLYVDAYAGNNSRSASTDAVLGFISLNRTSSTSIIHLQMDIIIVNNTPLTSNVNGGWVRRSGAYFGGQAINQLRLDGNGGTFDAGSVDVFKIARS